MADPFADIQASPSSYKIGPMGQEILGQSYADVLGPNGTPVSDMRFVQGGQGSQSLAFDTGSGIYENLPTKLTDGVLGNFGTPEMSNTNNGSFLQNFAEGLGIASLPIAIGSGLGAMGYGAGSGTAAAPAAASAGSSALDWNTIPSVGGAGVGADVGAGTGLTSQGMTTSLGGNLGTMPAGGLTTNTAAGGIGSATAAGLPAGTSTSLGGANFATGAGIGGAAAGGINPSSAVPTPTGGGSSGTAPIVDKSTQASAADIASANKGGIMQTLGLQDASGKINPLNAIGAGMMGLNVYNQAQAKKQASDFAAQMKAMGAPLTAAANQLLQLYASGQLLPSDQFKVQQFSQQQKSQLKNYYAQAGLGDSAMLQSALQQVDSQAAAMQSQMEQAYLTNASNVATQGNQYTMAGIQQQIATDQKLSDAQMNLLSTLAQLSAKQNNTTTATKP